MRKILSARRMIPIVVCFQVVPLLIFPGSAYSVKTQVWWLPVLLTFFVLVSLFQILIRKSPAAWPWNLAAFAQGISVISRIMMLLPHTTENVAGTQVFNAGYFIIAVVAMVLSAFEIWYHELPEVRRGLLSA